MKYYLNGKKISESEYEEIKKNNPNVEEIFDTGCDCYGNEYGYVDVII